MNYDPPLLSNAKQELRYLEVFLFWLLYRGDCFSVSLLCVHWHQQVLRFSFHLDLFALGVIAFSDDVAITFKVKASISLQMCMQSFILYLYSAFVFSVIACMLPLICQSLEMTSKKSLGT